MAHNQPGSSVNPQPPLHEDGVPLKVRRVAKACEPCRKRKVRCDGDPASSKGCTLCENLGVSCVFTHFTRKPGRESGRARELETRIIELEGIIRLMAPGIDIEQELDESTHSSDSANNQHSFLRPSDSAFLHPSAAFLPPSADSTTTFLHPDNLYQIAHEEKTKHDVNAHPPPRPSYSSLSYTEGSEFSIGVELAHAWKREIQPQDARGNSSQTNPAEYHGSYTKPLRDKLPTRIAPQDLWFPPEDLLYSLVDLYFKRFNILLPLLHRPTFEAQLADKLYWRDPSFAAVVLLVCANGSRFSDDTRVMPFYEDDVPPDSREFDAGIMFYRQVDVCSFGVFPVDVLFEHQIIVLGAILRLSMQHGIHRNTWQGEVNTHQKALNDEMWRRVFWSSYVLDVLFSAFYGRPTSVLSGQYDLAPPMPMEGEDPLAVNGFWQFTKLCEILTEITRTMYATGRKYDYKRRKLTSMPENEGRLREWYENLPQERESSLEVRMVK
ncbi:hypothetical protein BDV93DRAFT_76183 [Ceratobasidium sp. AG-I]|nr:hypothetical protein BDV93DRAFT_76183 [Ceratobasidium sp. AG-I]